MTDPRKAPERALPPGYIEATGDAPKVEHTRHHFAAVIAGLQTAREYLAEIERERDALAARVEELERELHADKLQERIEEAHSTTMKNRVEQLEEALDVAAVLLRGEGYHTDPDYRQEWQTIEDAFRAPQEKPRSAE